MTTPATTRAAVLTEHGADLELQNIPVPTTPEPGAALVRVLTTTLCGTDVEIWSGRMSFPGMLPMVLGHEIVGEVIAAGDPCRDALGSEIRPGDRIGWSESVCGRCHGCTILREPVTCSARGYGFLQRSDVAPFATGGLSEYAYVTPGAQKLRLPSDVSNTRAAAAGCAAKTVLRAFARAGGVRPGSTVAIQGSGALGLVATAVASISGAGRVITIGSPAERLSLAEEFGADATVDFTESTTVEQVLGLTGGRGADLVLDFAGAPTVGPEAVAMSATRGVFVVVGSTGPEPTPFPLSAIMRKELAVLGSINGDISDYHRAIELFSTFSDRFDWDALFASPCGLDAASEKLRSMHRLDEVKAVIDPSL